VWCGPLVLSHIQGVFNGAAALLQQLFVVGQIAGAEAVRPSL
jgi:hypothetical protein